MNPRYRITRNINNEASNKQSMSLDECKEYFATQPDFIHRSEYSVRSGETVMTITGEFFMWQIGEVEIPFRYYEGDVYVAVSHDIIFQKMLEVADGLEAEYVEG